MIMIKKRNQTTDKQGGGTDTALIYIRLFIPYAQQAPHNR